MKRVLITTAIEDSWPESGPVVFLGEWCRLYSRKERWEHLDGRVLRYHWDDRDKLFEDYRYLMEFYEKTLLALSDRLNNIHGVDHSKRYWRILIGPWVAYIIQIIFDRWSSINLAKALYDLEYTIILEKEGDRCIPNDMNNIIELMTGDEWNHFIYSAIIKHRGDIKIIKKPYRDTLISPIFFNNLKLNRKKIFKKASCLFEYLSRKNQIFFRATSLSSFSLAMLHLRFGEIPQFWRYVSPKKIEPKWGQREWKMPAIGKNSFENFVLKMIPKQVPKIFLEGYSNLVQQVAMLPWPKQPRVIYSASSLWHDTVFMAYTAEKVESGSPLVYGQHGGSYGTAKFNYAADHEIAISDRFLTWGWVDRENINCRPIGCVKLHGKANRLSKKTIGLLFITLKAFRYSYTLSSESSFNVINYIERNFEFTRLLTEKIKNKMLVRLHPSDNEFFQSMRWSDRFPRISLDLGEKKIYDLMRKSCLVVLSYNQTSFLEALGLEVPVVIFFDPKVTPLSSSALPHYEELKRVQIFHETPESAAFHINAVWEDVDGWWSGIELQKVVTSFKSLYCDRPKNMLNKIQNEINEIILRT